MGDELGWRMANLNMRGYGEQMVALQHGERASKGGEAR